MNIQEGACEREFLTRRDETIRELALFLLSRKELCVFERSPCHVVVYGGFAREARFAWLRCQQTVLYFLACNKHKRVVNALPRDVCLMICRPLLETYLCDVAWFSGEPIRDLDVRLEYVDDTDDIDAFEDYVHKVANVITKRCLLRKLPFKWTEAT